MVWYKGHADHKGRLHVRQGGLNWMWTKADGWDKCSMIFIQPQPR